MPQFLPGIDGLLTEHRGWIEGRRIGLISHRAAVDCRGRTTADVLHTTPGLVLTALFGPEHGFAGTAPAGEPAPDQVHPDWHIPVHSLYGARRRPTPEMLRAVDVLVYELQDIGARPYTYVSTLRACLEAAARACLPFVVVDRPIPLPLTIDGPLRSPAIESFVAGVPTPMLYGMTPAETALWLTSDLGLEVDLHVAPMKDYPRPLTPGTDWPPWVPPSPRMHSWETARCFCATVFAEAIPAVDNGSGTPLVFQVVGMPRLPGRELADALAAQALPGIVFEPFPFTPLKGPCAGTPLDGIRLRVTDAAQFRPAWTAVAIVACLQALLGRDRLWDLPGTRPSFFDELFGDVAVRQALRDELPPAQIARMWDEGHRRFRHSRAACLLYEVS